MPKRQPLYPHVPKHTQTPRSDIQRAMSHYGITEEEYRSHPDRYPLPLRGSGLATQEPPRERDKMEAIRLASQAISILKEAWHMNDFDAALWRLVDAAGLVAPYSRVDAVGREGNPTGRGFIVTFHAI